MNTSFGTLNLGTAGDTISIAGDLFVNGNLTSITSTDLEIKDRAILIGSGSTSGDIGIQFGEATSQGNMLVWEDAYSGSYGRFGVNKGNTISTWGTTGVDLNVDCEYHLATVFSGSLGDAQTARQDQIGNIRLEGGDAYIYA